MAVTVKDVAKRAEVSPATVSRVLNNAPSISPETREKVQKAISDLGYELPIAAETAAPHAIKSIGIILPPSGRETFENAFYLKAVRGITKICNQRHVASTMVTGESYEEILLTVQDLHRSGAMDGFIILYSRKNDIVVDYLCENGLLYVIVGKPSELTSQTACIDNDNLQASKEATDYLYSLGHRRIGYIGSNNGFMYTQDRMGGYKLSLVMNELPIHPEDCIQISGAFSHEVEMLKQLLKQPEHPTAFVVSDDMLALSLERVCNQMDLRIPEDISIIAFNNSLYAELTSPRLTSVDINSYQLGQEAAKHILSYAENPNLYATKIIVPHQIVERESCRRIG